MTEYGDIAKALKALKVSVDANTKATVANTKALNIPGAVVDAAVGNGPVRFAEDHPVFGGAVVETDPRLYGNIVGGFASADGAESFSKAFSATTTKEFTD